MHVLLTGAAGFLGTACREILSQRSDVQVSLLRSGYGPSLSTPPASSFKSPSSFSADDLAITIGPRAITHIIHVGALSSPEMCQREPERAHNSNVRFTQMLTEYAARVGAHLTTVSTDLVFDGTKAPINGMTEEDMPQPLSVYARSKYSSEGITLRTPSNTVIRMALLYGHSTSASRGILGWIEEAFKERSSLTLFADEYRTPVHVSDAAHAVLTLSERALPGIWHCGGPARLSRVEFGQLVAKALRYDPSLIRSTSRLTHTNGPARPEDVSLNSHKLWNTLGKEPRGVIEALS